MLNFPPMNEFLKTQMCKNSSWVKEFSENVLGRKDSSCSELEKVMQLQQQIVKIGRSGSSCLKRSTMFESEPSTSLNEQEEELKNISEKFGSHHMKKKSKFPKEKSHSIKRGEKRKFKVPCSVAKYNSSSLKMGATISGSAYEGNNFFRLYGLKHDIHDVTKLMNLSSLDELLRGTFYCPSLSKDKKKTSNTNESFLNSVRKACSLLHFPKSVQSQNIAEIHGSFYTKRSSYQMSSVCAVDSMSNGYKEQSSTSDMSACHKDLCTENKSPCSPVDFPLYQPKDVLDRIIIPPYHDLETLLLDVSKRAVPTKNSNNLRSGKQVSRQPSLPAFPWSHAFGGHSKINSDAVKLSTSKSTCQSKWTRVVVITSSADIGHGCFTNLDSFSYDQSLVPLTGSSNNKVWPTLFAHLPFWQWNSSSPVRHCKYFNAAADAYCPRLLEAAQTLCEIATYLPRQNPYGIIRLQKRTKNKTTKGKNLKPTAKLEEMPSTPTSVVGSKLVTRSIDQIIPAKKPRVSIVKNKNGLLSNNIKKGSYTQPSSTSMPLPSKMARDLINEKKHSAASILKELTMMYPADKILDKDKVYVGQKLGLMDWKRGKHK